MRFTREVAKDNSLPFLDCVVSLSKDGYLSIESMGSPSPTGAQTQGNLDTTRLASEGSLKHRGKTEGIDSHQDSAPDKWPFVKFSKRCPEGPPKAENEKQKTL